MRATIFLIISWAYLPSFTAVFAAENKFPPTFLYNKFETDHKKLPKRTQLPIVPGNVNGSAWLWGKNDGLGRLNFLTAPRISQSMKEAKTGEMIPLNLPVKLVDPPLYQRPKFNHTITKFGDGLLPVRDEEYHMNTQTSTQIDGFHHFAHLPTGLFYNGCTDDDSTPEARANNLKCGIQTWAEHGIAGRGILLDFASYAEAKGIQYDAFEATNITLKTLNSVARHQGLNLKTVAEGGDIRIGDILLVRTGFTKQYEALTPAERVALAERPYFAGPDGGHRFIGVDQTIEMADFLHDSYFSAVGGDAPAFESWPAQGAVTLHEQILSLWGVALGEFFDLEKLAEKCKKGKRWTFFVTSAPFNVERGVATWANALAFL